MSDITMDSNRVIYLTSDIYASTATAVVARLLYLHKKDAHQDIALYINSPGGEVAAGLAIYDTMQLISPKIQTFAVGWAASIAAVLLAAGEPGKRFALPNAVVMIHQPAQALRGYTTATDMKIATEQLERARHNIESIMAQHTGQTLERINKDSDRDYWMKADEAKEYGIVDYILDASHLG